LNIATSQILHCIAQHDAFILAYAATLVVTEPVPRPPKTTLQTKGAEKPTVQADLSAINSTHCSLTLTNESSQGVNLLKWNTLLDSDAEMHSFSVIDIRSGKKLPPGPKMARFFYDGGAIAKHTHELGAGAKWTGIFDLTRLFTVAIPEEYKASFTSRLNALPDRSRITGAY